MVDGLTSSNAAAFYNVNPIDIPLPQSYQRVGVDGTLGESINSIQLGGYEGVVLKRVK